MLRAERIRAKLDELRRRDRRYVVFGACAPHGHEYRCKPVLADREVRELERGFGIELPVELRTFLTTVHGGGAGPAYGFFLAADAVPRPRRARPFPFDTAAARDVIAQ